MYPIQQITSDAYQQQTLILEDGSSLFIQMYFMPQQYTWIFTEISRNSFTLTNFKIFNSPNMLRQYGNQIPFGLACFSINNREPSLQTDFSNEYSQLYILSAAEVAEYAAMLAAGSFTGA